MAKKREKGKANEGGLRPLIPKRRNIYARIAKYGPKAIKRVIELMDSGNPSVALGATKIVLNKIIPDLKAIHHTGELGFRRIPTPEEYEAALRALGIDPKTGRAVGSSPSGESEGSAENS